MGSGASSKLRAAATGPNSAPEKPFAEGGQPRPVSSIQPCEKCGEMRKTIRCGGGEEMLCTACHLVGTVKATCRPQRSATTPVDPMQASPRPVLQPGTPTSKALAASREYALQRGSSTWDTVPGQPQPGLGHQYSENLHRPRLTPTVHVVDVHVSPKRIRSHRSECFSKGSASYVVGDGVAVLTKVTVTAGTSARAVRREPM